MQKLTRLKNILKSYGDMALAYSGGKKSTVILAVASEVLEAGNMVAITAVSPIRREKEIKRASEFCNGHGIHHELILTEEYLHPDFIDDIKKRCFVCKEELYRNIKSLAEKQDFNLIVDGTTADDVKNDKPVLNVARKYGVKWPLAEAEIDTSEVESILDRLGLVKFAEPHYACSVGEIDLIKLVEQHR